MVVAPKSIGRKRKFSSIWRDLPVQYAKEWEREKKIHSDRKRTGSKHHATGQAGEKKIGLRKGRRPRARRERGG